MGVLKKAALQFVVIGVLLIIDYSAAAQQYSQLDTSKVDQIIRYGEPHYVIYMRAQNRAVGAQKARADDSLGELVLYRYYDIIDSNMVSITQTVVWQKYRLRFIPVLKPDHEPIYGYMAEADKIMKQHYGYDYWKKVEQQVDSIINATEWK